MKIFITGASGFIGSAIAKRLAPDHFVLGMARSDAASRKIQSLGARPVACSLDTVDVSHLKHVDVVIHCAANVKPWGRWEEYRLANVLGTQKLLQVAQQAGVKRFIHMSTESVLFHGQDMDDVDESYPYPAHSPFFYSESKKQSEQLVLMANAPGRFETLALRPRWVWGPGDTTILRNLCDMVDRGKFKWIGGGGALTSTCHIDNLVHAVVLALASGKGGNAYFITDWEVHTVRDFVSSMLRTQGRFPGDSNLPTGLVKMAAWVLESTYRLFGWRKKPLVTRFSAAIMSCNFTVASDKAQQDLGYKPVVTVEEGMQGLMNANLSGVG
jgi:nucleoside-diphosphate-sugar epimerase